MKTATVKELRTTLSNYSQKELMDICLRLSKFKKENKELLTYLLYEAADEDSYVNEVKEEMDEQFEAINRKSYYFIKKGILKIKRTTRKYIRYSSKKETEVELLLHFCKHLRDFAPSIRHNRVLYNNYLNTLASIRKKVTKLHEDLQYDYAIELEEF